MGLEEVKEEIINRAKQEADAIIRLSQKQAEDIREETLKEAKESNKRQEKATVKMLESLEKKELAVANFDSKKNLLDKKREIINEVMNKVNEHLENLGEKDREKYISALIDKAKKEIEIGTIYANKKDKKIIEAKGIKFADASMIGGIIAETKDGKISVNYSFEEILDEIKERSMQQIEKVLF